MYLKDSNKQYMKSTIFKIILFIMISIISSEKSNKLKIAIIGGGLGGTFTAYELLKTKSNFEVDLYDKKSKEGGRLYSEKKDNLTLDMGGSYFLEGQEFIESLLKELKIEAKPVEKKTHTGIFSKNEIFLELTDSKTMNFLKMFWRYGLSAISTKKIIDIQHNHFKKIYKHLQNKHSFNSIGDFLSYVGCEELISTTLEEYLHPVLSEKYISEIINSEVQSIYMQDAKTINAFTGMFALENFIKPCRLIENGSFEVVQKLLGRLEYNKNFKFFNGHHVVEIQKDKSTYRVITENGDAIEYDIVIIATPLYMNNKIKLYGNFMFQDESRLYYTPVGSEVAYVKGEINKNYFSLGESKELPEILISANQSETNKIVNIDHVKDNIYKIRGSNLQSQLDKIFKTYEMIKIKKWEFQCPIFRPFKNVKELPDFVLDDNLFYLNSIESIGDGMEISLISAHNVVNIIENKNLVSKKSKDEF